MKNVWISPVSVTMQATLIISIRSSLLNNQKRSMIGEMARICDKQDHIEYLHTSHTILKLYTQISC